MKIAVSPYELAPTERSMRAARRGALLQVTYRDGSIGYSDLHPWPELGDVPVDVQLQLLGCGHSTPLVTRAFSFARIDADARKAGRNLFANLNIPKSHVQLFDLVSTSGSQFNQILQKPSMTVKVKVGDDIASELKVIKDWSKAILKANAKLRFDFNSKLNYDSTIDFIEELGDLRYAIDFLEDPFPYNPQRWKSFKEATSIRLACDWDSLHALAHPNSCDVLVIKPAIQEIYPFLSKIRGTRSIVVTSYLDHPIGQLAAAYSAALVCKGDDTALSLCGLLTHHAYLPNPFSATFAEENGSLIPHAKGAGWGCDEVLKGLSWRTLN